MNKLIKEVAQLIKEVLSGAYQTEKGEEHFNDLISDMQNQVNDIQVLHGYEVITTDLKWEMVSGLEEAFEQVTGKCFAYYIEVEQEEE